MPRGNLADLTALAQLRTNSAFERPCRGSVSNSTRQLEERLEVRLLNHTTRSVSLSVLAG
jgi:hypothetical protein